MKELKFDGERVVPNNTTPPHILKEHFDRYIFAKKYVKDKIVLDIACGTGYGSFELANSGAKKVIGGDISKKAIYYAKKKYKKNNLSFKEMNGSLMSLLDNSVDVVVSFETIEHLSNYKKFLSEVKRVLKSGGLFICSSPNKTITSPFTKKPLNSYHVKEFKIREVVKTFRELNFEDIEAFGQSFVNNNFKFKIKNLIRSYFGFTARFYKKFLKSSAFFESAKNVNGVRKLKKIDLEPTYFIILSKKK